jgi:L-threonylcarbamoyladenylate synthase
MSSGAAGARFGATPFESPEDVERALPEIVRHLRSGGVIAYPTETIYGLGSSLEPAAVERIIDLKQRREDRPFLILVDSPGMLGLLGLELDADAAGLAREFWPGPLTLVLQGTRTDANRNLCGPNGETAVRWTSHDGARCIIDAHGAPITSTSANVRGLPPAATAIEIVAQWEREVAEGSLMVLDGGALTGGVPSTVIDCSTSPPRLTRMGAIAPEALLRIVPTLVR